MKGTIVMKFDELGDVLTPEEIINALPFGRSTIYSLLRSGAIKTTKICRKYIVLKSDLMDFLQDKNYTGATNSNGVCETVSPALRRESDDRQSSN